MSLRPAPSPERRTLPLLSRFGRAALLGLVLSLGAALLGTSGCGRPPRAAVDLKLKRAEQSPRSASVYIDEQFIGKLGYVAPQIVRLPKGEHRITITKPGYFPWDRLVVSDRQPIVLDVKLVPIPD